MDPPAEPPCGSTDEELSPAQSAPEDLPTRLQSIVRTLQASPRAFRRVIDARFRGSLSAESSSPSAPGSPSLGRRLISRLLPSAATATPSSAASSGGEEESYGGPCSSSSSSAPTSSGQPATPAARLPSPGETVTEAGSAAATNTATSSLPLPVPEIVLQAPEAVGGWTGEGEDVGESGGRGDDGARGGKGAPLARPTGFETIPTGAVSAASTSTKLLTLVVCGGGGGSGGSSTVVDGGGGSEGGGAAVPGGAEGLESGGISVVPARKSPVTVQEWVDSLPHSGAATPVPHEASHSGALLCRSEDEEGEERPELTGEGASAAQSDMVEDGLSLGAEAGHLYSGCVPDEVMCPRQPSSEPSTATPASQTSRRERSGGGSSATAKRREAFAGRRRDGEGMTDSAGGGSFQSDTHSPASHSSIDSLLESRRPDPEEMLFGLGFGGPTSGASLPSQGSAGGGPGSVSGSQRGAPSPFPFGSCGNDGGSDEEVSRIPRRFLQPSKVKGVAINDFFKYQQDLIETFESGFCGYRGLTGMAQALARAHRRGDSRIPLMNMLWSIMNNRCGPSIPVRFLPSLMSHARVIVSRSPSPYEAPRPQRHLLLPPSIGPTPRTSARLLSVKFRSPAPSVIGPSHTVPSVIVAKIMEKLREHEREQSSRGSVASFGTGPNCHSPTPPPTPPFSPSSPMVCSPLEDERLHFLHHQPQPVPQSPVLSPVESQPTTTKFSKVARNVMQRTSILTRMSSVGGESAASTDDGSGIASSPTGRMSLSVLTPDNRKFLDSQGSKSPEMSRKRMIIGQRSFTFDTDGDLIEDLTPPKETPVSPTLPPKPPLVHKDSIISSVTSLTSCDSDSDTDSAPNFRSASARSSGGKTQVKARASGSNSSDSLAGPWPLGKRMSSTSLSSWEEMGDGPSPSTHFGPRGQRPRFLSIDEGDNESMEGQEEVSREKWIIGSADEHDKEEWLPTNGKQGSEGGDLLSGEMGLSEGGSQAPASEKVERLSPAGESSVNEGLWELELDQNEISGEIVADTLKAIPPPSPPLLNPLVESNCEEKMEDYSEAVRSSEDVHSMVDQNSVIVESKTVSAYRDQGEEHLDLGKEELQSKESTPQECLLPSVSSLSNFSSCSSAQESSISSVSIRRGSLKRQTKFEVEEEAALVDSISVDMAVDALNETPRAVTPNSQCEDVSTAEPSQQVSEVSSVVAEPIYTNRSSSAMKEEEMPCIPKREGESVREEERQRRALSPHGRSGSAHSDSSGFLEWEPTGAKATAMPLSPPSRPLPLTSLRGNGKSREWRVAEESSQLPSPDGGTTVGSSECYGVEGLSSEVTGQQLQADTVELALRALQRSMEGDAEGDDSVGREVALGGGDWRGVGISNIGEASSDGIEEETLQQTHQELAFVREMRCCVSEGLDRVMQFLGTCGKHRRSLHHPQIGQSGGDAAKVSSIMSQMTFLLKQQSKLCYEMEQLSMQRLLNGQLLGASSCEKQSEVKGGPHMLGIKEGERGGTVVIHGKGVMKGNFQNQSTSTQCITESGANSRELYLEGVVEQNARELAELKLLLKAVLTPSNPNDRM